MSARSGHDRPPACHACGARAVGMARTSGGAYTVCPEHAVERAEQGATVTLIPRWVEHAERTASFGAHGALPTNRSAA